jgi:hypothetical protein
MRVRREGDGHEAVEVLRGEDGDGGPAGEDGGPGDEEVSEIFFYLSVRNLGEHQSIRGCPRFPRFHIPSLLKMDSFLP